MELGGVRREVHDDQHRRRQVVGEAGDDRAERLEAARRGSDHDDVAPPISPSRAGGPRSRRPARSRLSRSNVTRATPFQTAFRLGSRGERPGSEGGNDAGQGCERQEREAVRRAKEKAMSNKRAARIANSPGASSRGGESSGGGSSKSNSKQGGPTAQKKAAGRKAARSAPGELTLFLPLWAYWPTGARARCDRGRRRGCGASWRVRVRAGLLAAGRIGTGGGARSARRAAADERAAEPRTTFVRVRQRVGGVPVLGADATLTSRRRRAPVARPHVEA